MITKIVCLSTRIITIYTIKRSISFEFEGQPMKTEPKTGSKFPNQEKASAEQICIYTYKHILSLKIFYKIKLQINNFFRKYASISVK